MREACAGQRAATSRICKLSSTPATPSLNPWVLRVRATATLLRLRQPRPGTLPAFCPGRRAMCRERAGCRAVRPRWCRWRAWSRKPSSGGSGQELDSRPAVSPRVGGVQGPVLDGPSPSSVSPPSRAYPRWDWLAGQVQRGPGMFGLESQRAAPECVTQHRARAVLARCVLSTRVGDRRWQFRVQTISSHPGRLLPPHVAPGPCQFLACHAL